MQKLLPFAWGLSISLGALWIRFASPGDRSPLLARLIETEPVHWVCHFALYGALAWFATRTMPLRWVVPVTLLLGLVQELSQVLGERTFGGPEIFDLGVDAAGALVVVWLRRRVG